MLCISHYWSTWRSVLVILFILFYHLPYFAAFSVWSPNSSFVLSRETQLHNYPHPQSDCLLCYVPERLKPAITYVKPFWCYHPSATLKQIYLATNLLVKPCFDMILSFSVPDHSNPLWEESWLPIGRRPPDPHKKCVIFLQIFFCFQAFVFALSRCVLFVLTCNVLLSPR